MFTHLFPIFAKAPGSHMRLKSHRLPTPGLFHCRILWQHLQVRHLTQAYLSSALKVFCYLPLVPELHVLITLRIEPRTLHFSAQFLKDEIK